MPEVVTTSNELVRAVIGDPHEFLDKHIALLDVQVSVPYEEGMTILDYHLAQVESLRAEAEALVINGIDDTEGEKAVRAKLSETISRRTNITDTAKAATKPLYDTKASVDRHARQVENALQTRVEDVLRAKLKAVTDERERLEREKRERLQARLAARTAIITKLGFILVEGPTQNPVYVLGELKRTAAELYTMHDGEWEEFHAAAQKAHRANQAAEQEMKEQKEREAQEVARQAQEARDAAASARRQLLSALGCTLKSDKKWYRFDGTLVAWDAQVGGLDQRVWDELVTSLAPPVYDEDAPLPPVEDAPPPPPPAADRYSQPPIGMADVPVPPNGEDGDIEDLKHIHAAILDAKVRINTRPWKSELIKAGVPHMVKHANNLLAVIYGTLKDLNATK